MRPAPTREVGLPLAGALAYAGAVVGYAPLIGLLLPAEVARIAGNDRYSVLALVMAVGAVVAGAANLAFGWLSDRSRRRGGGRRRWIAIGFALMLASFAAVWAAHDVAAIVVAIAIFQVAINAVLGPLMALLAEEVPAARTGLTAGLFAAGPLLAMVVSLTFAVPALRSEGARLTLVAAISAVCLLPVLTMRPPMLVIAAGHAPLAIGRRDLALAWAARLFVQVAGNVLFSDLLYLMDQPIASDDGSAAFARIGTLLLIANLLPLPIAVVLGRWSDHRARRSSFLFAAATSAAVGLATMAASSGWNGRAAGFLLFATGWGVFLPLQVGDVMRLLPDPDHRGRDLGILNLANTLPVLIGQGLTWWLATPQDAAALLLALAGLSLAGGTLMLAVGSRR